MDQYLVQFDNLVTFDKIWKHSFDDLKKTADQDEFTMLKYSNNLKESQNNRDIYSHLFVIDGNIPYKDITDPIDVKLSSSKKYFSQWDKENFLYNLPKTENRSNNQKNSNCYKMKTRINHRNKPLNKAAVQVMEKWYMKHYNYPYPNNEEKEKLALKGYISIAQVNSWFANRRNRSDNTKPKNNRKYLEAHLKKFAEELEVESYGTLKAHSIASRLTEILKKYN